MLLADLFAHDVVLLTDPGAVSTVAATERMPQGRFADSTLHIRRGAAHGGSMLAES